MTKKLALILLIILLSNTVLAQERYESFSNWFRTLPEYEFNGISNSITLRSNLYIISGTTISALIAYNYDAKLQKYSQERGLLPDKISKFGDLYGGAWSAWLLPASVILTSKSSNDTNKEMLQKLDYTLSALAVNGFTTILLKELIGRQRPNGRGNRSMPSGHTSHSFTVAAVAHELYGNEVGIAAYLLAGLVGISRINDNKHFLTDVIVGAGIGTVIGRGFAKTYNKYSKNEKENNFNINVSFSIN